MTFFGELKRRNVFRVAALYVVTSWLVLQVADLLFDTLELPPEWARLVLAILILGFPLVVIFSWAYEITPEGLKRESELERSPSVASISAKRLNYVTIVVVALGVTLFAIDRFAPRSASTSTDAFPADSAGQPGFLDDRPAIAVLPFENLSPDPDQAFFADGLAEDLISRLSQWRAFPVIARNSSFQYRGGEVDLRRVSEELGVRYIVEGSVRRTGEQIRVTAQLIDAPTGEHVWADTYDRDVADVFAMQDQISTMIAAPLVDDLHRAEARRARQHGTDSLEAWSLYQLGLQHADRFTREDFAAARELFTLAADRDPQFATVLAELCLASLWEVALGWNESPVETIAASLELARRAEALDPRDPVTQAALGWAFLMSGDLNNGLAATRRAIELNPSMPMAWGWFSWAQLLAGEAESCISAAERTLELNPLGAFTSIVYDNLSQCYWQQGHYEAGLDAAHRLLAELPDYFLAHVFVAMNAVPLGRLDEARAAIAAARLAQPDLSLELVQGMYGVERPEIDARRNTILRQAGLE